MAFTSSRVSRIEEKKTKRRLFLTLGGIIAIIVILYTVGIPLLARVSAILGSINSSQPNTANADTTAPFAPTLSPVNSSTNSAQLKLEGYAEPESTLKVMLNGEEAKKVLLGTEGSFSFDDITLDSGENTLYATATDDAGNESAISKELKIIYKKGAPKLEVTEPSDGQTFGKNQQEIVVKGKTDKGVDLRINDRFVTVKDDGTFEYSLKLGDGENTLVIVVQDLAGNQTKIERKVTYSP